jgi:hypothetical protein
LRSLCTVLLSTVVMCQTTPPQHALVRRVPRSMSAMQPQPTTQPQGLSNEELNNAFVQQISKQIAGREDEPAERVFGNIQIEWFKAVPARRLLSIMSGGYSRALGVSCTHCHVAKDFASDAQRPKRAAREMAMMHRLINQQLASMQNLEIAPEDRFINCATCHRGAIDPRASQP